MQGARYLDSSGEQKQGGPPFQRLLRMPKLQQAFPGSLRSVAALIPFSCYTLTLDVTCHACMSAEGRKPRSIKKQVFYCQVKDNILFQSHVPDFAIFMCIRPAKAGQHQHQTSPV
jgi:hypothetical protein